MKDLSDLKQMMFENGAPLRLVDRVVDYIRKEFPQSSSPFNAVGLRWVKASERLPNTDNYIPIKIEDFYLIARFEGCDDGIYGIMWSCIDTEGNRIDNNENKLLIEYLEEYTPSLNSVENMAKDEIAQILYKHSENAHRNVGKGCNYEEYILSKDFFKVINDIAGFIAGASNKESEGDGRHREDDEISDDERLAWSAIASGIRSGESLRFFMQHYRLTQLKPKQTIQ